VFSDFVIFFADMLLRVYCYALLVVAVVLVPVFCVLIVYPCEILSCCGCLREEEELYDIGGGGGGAAGAGGVDAPAPATINNNLHVPNALTPPASRASLASSSSSSSAATASFTTMTTAESAQLARLMAVLAEKKSRQDQVEAATRSLASVAAAATNNHDDYKRLALAPTPGAAPTMPELHHDIEIVLVH
jgi:hypothetical protein